MKKILALFLAFALVFSFSACGEKDEKLVPIVETETVTLKAQEDVFPENTVVTAEKISSGEGYTTAANALKNNAKKFEVYDITAKSDNIAVQPNGKVEATFDIPDGFDVNRVSVVYISEGGLLETLTSIVNKDAKTITAELSHFSLYAVIEAAKVESTQSDSTESEKTESEDASSTESAPQASDKPDETVSKVPETSQPVVCMHKYSEATCTAPKTCTLCKKTDGKALGHDYKNGVCSRCKASDPNFKSLKSGYWACDIISNGELNAISLHFSEETCLSVGVGRDIATMDKEAQDEFKKPEYADSLCVVNGVTYYIGMGFSVPFTFVENGDTVVITEEESTNTITLKRHSSTQYIVSAISGNFGGMEDILKVNTIFTFKK